jgi:MFS family permease
VADTFNRRKIMFITQVTMAVTSALLWLLTWLGIIQIWQIYLLSGLLAAALAFDLPARQSLVPTLVPRAIQPSAYSLTSIAFNTGAILGPALSGVVIASLGQAYTYFFDAVSFGAVLVALLFMGPIA